MFHWSILEKNTNTMSPISTAQLAHNEMSLIHSPSGWSVQTGGTALVDLVECLGVEVCERLGVAPLSAGIC